MDMLKNIMAFLEKPGGSNSTAPAAAIAGTKTD
jgi:hypothetical protein